MTLLLRRTRWTLSAAQLSLAVLSAATVTLVAMSLEGCDGTSSASAGEVEAIAQKQFPVAAPDNDELRPSSISIAVDASESMRGFASTNAFQHLLQNTVFALGPLANNALRFYTFDTDTHRVHDFVELLTPAIFHGVRADFGKAFALPEADPNGLLVVITDLQFNNQRFFTDLVMKFQQEISRGRYVKLFGTTTGFNGRIFPQFGAGGPFQSTRPRPLYAVVVGDYRYAAFIERVLRRAMPWQHSISLSNGGPVKAEILYANVPILGPAQVNGSVQQHTVVLQSGGSGPVEFELKMETPRLPEWLPLAQGDIAIEAYVLRDTTLQRFNRVVRVDSVRAADDAVILRGSSVGTDRVAGGGAAELWRVSIRPEEVPGWVTALNCQPEENQAERTVYLKDFVLDVIKPVTQPFTVATAHLYILDP